MRRYSNPDFAAALDRLRATPAGLRPAPSRLRQQLQRRLQPEEITDLVDAYSGGTGIKELAQIFRIHRHTVMAHLRRHGLDSRHGVIERHLQEATRLYEAGSSLASVGRRFDVHASTVLRALRAAGVVIRPRQGGR